MRNATKLKTLLLRYTVSIDLEEEQFRMMLFDRAGGNTVLFEGKSYSAVLAKAYSHLLKELRTKDKNRD